MNPLKLLFASVCLGTILSLAHAQPVTLRTDFSEDSKALPHYWKSTGFSPSDLLEYPDMEMTLNYLQSLHGEGVKYIRPHYLLDQVKIMNFATPQQAYDWSVLDAMMDKMVENKLHLIFELMGNPEGIEAINFADDAHLHGWKQFVQDLAEHYTERYGTETVEAWWFETSNEPDLWHFWPHGFVKFLNYYDACSEGLLAANPKIKFGGPGTARGASATFKMLMEHCAYGRNYFTGEQGVRIDFISTHRKNTPHEMIKDELKVWRYVEHDFPEFHELPIVNDESDPIAGWGIPYFWRTGPWYAAFVAQAVDLHNRKILGKITMPYGILSNDNAFMGSWGKRTHLARFIPGDNDQSTRGSSRTGGSRFKAKKEDDRVPVERFFLIKKPDLSIMSLLSLLGNERFELYGIDDTLRPHLGGISTRTGLGNYAICVYNKPELELKSYKFKPTMQAPEEDRRKLMQGEKVALELANVEPGIYQLIHYRLDETYTNPYGKWQSLGSPEDPSLEQYRQLSAVMEPEVMEQKEIVVTAGKKLIETINFTSSGVSLMILAKKSEKPANVQGLKLNTYLGVSGETQRMLLWDQPQSENILSYEVYFRPKGKRKFSLVNQHLLLDHGYVHALQEATPGEYKVRVKDYWGKYGDFSPVLKVE